MNSEKLKIVVTSIGVSSPMGYSVDSFFSNYEKASNTLEATHIDDSTLTEELKVFKNVDQRRMDRLAKIAVMAAVYCLKNANLVIDESNINDIGGIFCTAFGPIASARNFIQSGLNIGLTSASPLIFPYTVGNAVPGIITILMKARGYNTTVSGYSPIVYAYDIIKNGKAKALIAGGFEELSSELEEAYKCRHIFTKEGTKISSPITSVSEGSAMLFVEEENYALDRNANILFEISGYGVNSNFPGNEKSYDNFGYILPVVINKSMRMALDKSGFKTNQIAAIISLSRDDSGQTESEMQAINDLWDSTIPNIHYIKKRTGETFGASDTFGVIVGYLEAKKLKSSPSEKINVMVNSYHIGGCCFSLIITI